MNKLNIKSKICIDCGCRFESAAYNKVRCYKCQNKRRKEYQRDLIKSKEYSKKRWENPVTRKIDKQRYKKWQQTLNGMYSTYKRNAKIKDRTFNLTKKEFKNLISQSCYYCGIKGNPYNGIDRIDSNNGYVLENLVPCCFVCNRMKMDLTIQKFLKKCEKITHHRFIEECVEVIK